VGADMRSFSPAVHRAIMWVGIEGSAGLPVGEQLAARDVLYRVLDQALAFTGVARQATHFEDRGDGPLVLVPPTTPIRLLVEVIPQALADLLHRHNVESLPGARFRVRLAIHAGEVQQDERGFSGASLVHAARLLDGASFREALYRSESELGVIVSNWLYEEVIRQDPALDHSAYQPVITRVKGTTAKAWIRLFPDTSSPAQLVGGRDPRPAIDPRGSFSPPDAHDFDAFYLSRFPFVRNVINARAQDWALAADVADEAMVIAFRRWDDLRDHSNPTAFVIVTARRILSRIQRQRAAKTPPIPPLSLEATPGLELHAIGADPANTAVNRAALDQALRALPADQRECFVLHHILDRPVREIAELLNLPEGTIKTRLRSARQTLRDLLKGEAGEEGHQ
jgi:RNA polymerase sigma factor (sigma-70 family)